jgi:methylenetetrahydrofolate reductase (NADPH)
LKNPARECAEVVRNQFEIIIMLVRDILDSTKTAFSFEFFPPKTDKGWDTLFQTISDLMPLKPDCVSVTYGAGGTTRDKTHDLVVRITNETDLTVVSHLTTVGSTREEIYEILKRYDDAGIDNILALRGDPPKGQEEWRQTPGGFAYASELVTFIKEHFPNMGIGVAGFPEGHPATVNRLKEMEYLKEKVDAGADYIVTQLFFDNRDFYDFRERADMLGINVPIVTGIMPVTSTKGMMKMADLAAGSRFPAPLLRRLNRAETEEQVEEVGVHWATEQVMDLLENDVRGIHFYTLNQSDATLRIYKQLGVKDSEQLLH